MTRSTRLGRRTMLAGGLLTLAVAAVIALLLGTVEDLRNSQRLARHSELVLSRAATTERLLLDMETGLRGYVITHRREFLQPLREAVGAFPAVARSLESLARDRPPQEARARAIDAAIRSYATTYAAPLAAMASRNPGAARTVAATAEGKRRVDAIRARFTAFEAEEGRLATSRQNHADAVARRAVVEAVGGLIGLVALAALMTLYLRRAVVREERALDEAREAEARLGVLARASAALSESLDHERTLEQVAHIAVPAIADWCSVDLADGDGSLRNVAVAHTDPEKVALARELQERYPPNPDDPTGAPNVIRSGDPELYPEITEEMLVDGAQDEEHLRISRELGLVSAMVVPLIARGRTLGAITLVAAESGRVYGEGDLTYAEDLARRAALAIDNARLYEQERRIAETLQRSLLPETLPVVPRAAVAARYLPAEVAAEVGGDWYDVIPLQDGHVALAIGDVVGHGVKAAAVMGQIRSALRAYALEGGSAGPTLERLKAMLRASAGGMVGTLLLAVYDPATGRLSYASAGHPPPLVREPDGSTRFLNDARSTPLGVGGHIAREAETTLEPGSLMLLYTDGLVERRRERLTDGLTRLERAVASGPADVEGLLDHVLRQLGSEGPSDDDIALVVLSPAHERAGKMHIRLPAERNSVTSARHTMARWLSGAGADEVELYEISVALADACANAVEHAYGPGDAAFEVGAELIDGEVVIDVRDLGRWREPRGVNRGRGLQLMNAFTDSLEIDTGETGTHVRMRRRLNGGRGA